MFEIVPEKISQGIQLLQEQNLDCWLTFVRETTQTHDPALDLLLGFDLTWDSALLLTRAGEAIAIVGRYEADNVRKLNAYTRIVSYDQGISQTLRDEIARIAPQQIGVNYSLSSTSSDGLTHGMYLRLMQMFADTPFANKFVSADGVSRRLRERKSASELSRIRTICKATEEVYANMFKLPLRGMTEKQVHAVAGEIAQERNFDWGWGRSGNPIVNAGPDSSIGHGMPADIAIQPGMLLHLDMGFLFNGYCSDLQRMAYVLREGERTPPPEVQRAWQACWAAMDAGFAALKAGVPAWQVDDAARKTLVAHGYPEYLHAFGHHVGRRVHDGGSVLGPRWERYGETPYHAVEQGSVFTIELGTMVAGYGYIGLEEMVVVNADGAEYLSKPQRELILI